MKIKTNRFAVAAAILLALCLVFVAPVGAGDLQDATDAVAKIGDGDYYSSLQYAFDNATDGSIITLLKDVEYTSTNAIVSGEWKDGLVYNGDKSFTFDLNGKTISCDDDLNDYLIYLNNKGSKANEITFKNGTITGGENLWNVICVSGDSATYPTTLNLDSGLTVYADGSGNDGEDGGVKVRYTSTVNVKDGAELTSTSALYLLQAASTPTPGRGGSTANVYDGAIIEQDYNNQYAIAVTGTQNVNIYGGTINAAGDAAAVHTSSSGTPKFTIYGGTINGDVISCADVSSYPTAAPFVEIKGGTITGDVGSEIFGTATDGAGSKMLISGGEITGDIQSDTDAEVSITGGSFTDLSGAVKHAAESATIKLADDVELDSTLTIEKDVTITADEAVTITDNVNSDAFAVTESGKLTLGKNIKITSTIGAVLYANGGEIIIDGAEITSGNSNYATVAVWNGGKLTILDGSIKSTATDLVTVSVKNAGSELIVNGGEINSITTSALAVLDSASATISGGTLTSSAEDRCVAYSASNGVIKITGGTLSGAHSWALIAAADGIVEVSGGTVDGVLAHGNAVASATISGGTINGNVAAEDGASMTITGGTFSVNPSAYIPSDYEVVQPGDKYLVQKYVDRSSSSSSSSSTTEPEEPEQPEEPVVEPETPAAPGETTVETEVTDGGEVELETPAAEGESAAADEDETKITGVVLPTGTDSEVAFVPVSEQPAPAGQEENTKKVFEINVPSYEKGKAAVIKFTMTVAELAADGKEAADVALWHFDEETGEWTKLVTSYTIVDGVVYFEAITEDFSPFAIIYEDEPADEPVEEPETPASPAPVLGLLAALGAAVVLRRK